MIPALDSCDHESATSNGADRQEAVPDFYILVVDDSRVTRKVLGDLLQGAGYAVLFACDGLEALAALENHGTAIALVLLDRIMPNLDGMEVLARMKRHERWNEIPVIMQTSATSAEDVRTGIAAGVYYYLTKPFHEGAVLGMVKATLEDIKQRQAWREALQEDYQGLGCMTTATFRVRTLEEVSALARFLAKFCPEPERVIMGLGDLLINAVEHGNLGITYEEKTQLQEEGRWEQEIRDRLAREPYASKYVEVEFEQTKDRIQITIRDQGRGFDWKPYLEFDSSLVFATHGRGIAMAKAMCFDELEYYGAGNVVVGRVSKVKSEG